MYFDMPLEELIVYLPERNEPKDFDSFWKDSVAQARTRSGEPHIEAIDFGHRTVETFDLTFSGFDGQPIKGWFIVPRQRSGRLPCVVEFIGYGGGRAFPADWLLWSSLGYAHLVMDTRGQGSEDSPGDTPDAEAEGANPQYPGFLTRGILDPRTYYYRRLVTDAVRAVDTARAHPFVDPSKIAVTGASQGGGIALAVAGLDQFVSIAMPDVPFLCHYRRAVEITDSAPYSELTGYLRIHRDKEDVAFRTLSYFDGLNFAARAQADSLFSVGLMDDVCPPSTVFAAFNHYAGPKDIRIWPYSQHEAREHFHVLEKIKFMRSRWS
jgi:cephalosporin-C deacetylase